MYAPGDEIIALVDEENRVTGSCTRREMRQRGLLHRATYVFVFDRQGRLHAQLRTLTKDVCPGYWDLCAGGVVLAGESYEESAERELGEELGIRGVAFDPWFDFLFEDHGSRVWGRAFGCVYEGPLQLQAEEVVRVEMVNVEQILSGVDGRLFTPDSMAALRRKFPI